MKTATKKQVWPYVKPWTYADGTRAYAVDTRTKDGGGRKFFPTQELAEAHARAERIARQNMGSTYDMNTGARMGAMEATRLLAEAHVEATLVDAVRFFIRHAGVAQSKITVNEVIDLYFKKQADKGRRPRTIGKDVYILKSGLGGVFGERKIATVTTKEIQDWIEAKDVAVETKNNFLQTVHAFFNFAKAKPQVFILENPATPIEDWNDPDAEDDIKTLSAAQVEALLNAALKVAPEIVPALVLNVFAGLRPEAECARIGWERIKGGKVYISGAVSKTKSSRRTIDRKSVV